MSTEVARNADNLTQFELNLVWQLARRYCGRLSAEELASAGFQGLLEAKERFDGRGKLSTYATYWIKRRIFEELKREKRAGFTDIARGTEFRRNKLPDILATEQQPQEDCLAKYRAMLKEQMHLAFFRHRFEQNLTLRETGILLGVSKTTAYKLELTVLCIISRNLREQSDRSSDSIRSEKQNGSNSD